VRRIEGGGKSKYCINSKFLFTDFNVCGAKVALYRGLTINDLLETPPNAALRGAAVC
jgi:hypothetical protein